MTLQEHIERFKVILKHGIWVTEWHQYIPFAALEDDYLCNILRQFESSRLLWCDVAQKLLVLAQNRNLNWRSKQPLSKNP